LKHESFDRNTRPRAGGEPNITSINSGDPILPAFLVTTTNLVEADDEIEASRKALEEIILGPRVSFEVRFDDEHRTQIVIGAYERTELMKQAGIVVKADETSPHAD
jgi:hypothetical protein